jgi:hypothetical protein
MKWEDLTKIYYAKTNQLMNFVQCRVLLLLDNQGKKIFIPEKLQNYELFIDKLKRNKPDMKF